MITFLTGVPGSGKTYKAVYTIFNNFSSNDKAKKDLKKDFINCYTNINEFKFDKVEYVYKLDFDELKNNLTKLHKLYKSKVTDDELIAKCKEFGIYKSLFVIDEAHNYFDINDVVLVWWLSYHRHLYQDIYLITQNLSLVHSKYKTFSEFFFRAKSTTVSLNRDTFKYDVYINSRLAMNARSHTERLSKIKEVFDLYQSGDEVVVSNILLKFYVFSFLMVVAGVVFIYFYFSSSNSSQIDSNISQIPISRNFSQPIQNTSNVKNQNQSPVIQEIKPTFETTDRKLFSLFCNSKNCFNDDILLPIPLFEHFLKSNNIKLLYTDKKTANLYKFYLDTTEEFYKYISNKKVKNDEKVISNSSFISPALPSK